MKCPVCNATDAYVGLQVVECKNPKCIKFVTDDPNRPATEVDIEDIQKQIAQTCNDPNTIIVTHNGFGFGRKDFYMGVNPASLRGIPKLCVMFDDCMPFVPYSD